MKIHISGIYRRVKGQWTVELPALSIQVEGKNPFRAFKSLEELIQKEIDVEDECIFKISDNGQFELNTGKSPELVKYIAKRICDFSPSTSDLNQILAQIKFKGDLDE